MAGLLLWSAPVAGQVRFPDSSGGGAVRPVTGALIRPFIPPEHPYGPGHRGVDLAAIPGATVRAALSGTVAFAGSVAGTGWVTLRHGESLVTTYGDVLTDVTKGDAVSAGQVVAHLADGASHLDWGARLDGAYIDPLRLLDAWRLRLADPASVPTGQPIRVDPVSRTAHDAD